MRVTKEDKPLNRFLSDTQKIVHRHLADRNHVITEEELRNIRIGMMPSPEMDSLTTQADEGRQRNSDTDPAGTPVTLNESEP